MSEKKVLTSDSPIRFVRGIGEKKAEAFERLGVATVRDLLYLFPRAYTDKSVITKLSDAHDGEKCTFILRIVTLPENRRARSGLSYCSFIAADESGSVAVTVFGREWFAGSIAVGDVFRARGELKTEHFARKLNSPELEPYRDDLPPLVPVYPLTKGLTCSYLSRCVANALGAVGEEGDVLDDAIREEYSLMTYKDAMREIHFPTSIERVEEARKRFAFEELLLFQLGILSIRRGNVTLGSPEMRLQGSGIARFFASLPFPLTHAQERCIKEIVSDLERQVPMSRLLQGDVGSGKTVVAASCAYLCVKNGYQCAVMAPTEILALQHYETFGKFLKPFGINVVLLTGAGTAKEKNAVRASIADKSADVIIGTHSLLYSQVTFASLGLVITDEQHRFGVVQRARLAEKGEKPHTLVMSATPIPRTLSLILYGDLDLSVIDELPPGRKKTDTFCVGENYRLRLYDFIRKTVGEGHQVYIICPLVEDGDIPDLKAVMSHGRRLQEEVFTDLRVGLLHGKMTPKQKDAVMSEFASGKTDVLVSTTVIEVGVDVPNATLMIIENADRYGLSQLHQLRGRVGRGADKSYCVLVSDGGGAVTRQRLETMCETNDGFKIAETDLRLRGPGDFIGERQHGAMNFRIADIAADMELVASTRALAEKIMEKGLFTDGEHALLALGVRNVMNKLSGEAVLN